METKFTKGEWGSCCTDAIPHFVFDEGGALICHIAHNDIIADVEFYEPLMETVTIEEARANAKLIAAAPDLFKALVDLMDGVEALYGGQLNIHNKLVNLI
jgi:hypothetical protein